MESIMWRKIQKLNASAAAAALLVNIMLASALRENQAKNHPKNCGRRISSDDSAPTFHFCNLSIKHWSSLFVSGQNGVSRADTPVVLGVNMD